MNKVSALVFILLIVIELTFQPKFQFLCKLLYNLTFIFYNFSREIVWQYILNFEMLL